MSHLYDYDDFDIIDINKKQNNNRSNSKPKTKKTKSDPTKKVQSFNKPGSYSHPKKFQHQKTKPKKTVIYDDLFDDFDIFSHTNHTRYPARKKTQKTYTRSSHDYSDSLSYNSYNYDTNSYTNSSTNTKLHIIVNPFKGDYTLLDKNMNVADKMHKNYILHMFTRRFSLRKFKKELKQDFKLYEQECNRNNVSVDPKFKSVNKHIKFCLSLCPDADYQILELLRRNITKVDPTYSNYQTACAQYLHELAVDTPYPERMPFDLFYVCDGSITNTHKNIATPLERSNDPIADFRRDYYINNFRDSYLQDQHIEVFPKQNIIAAQHVSAPIDDRDR